MENSQGVVIGGSLPIVTTGHDARGIPRRGELVEAAGVEPASEKVYREKTTCVSDSVFFDRSIRTGKREAA
jgi:hypothetical protein